MAYKPRSLVTKHAACLNCILFPPGGGKVQPWGIILNCVLPSCVQPRKLPAHIFFSLSHNGSMTLLPRTSPFSFLNCTCASLKIVVMFLPAVNFVLIFMFSLNAPFPWSQKITRSIDKIDFFFGSSSNIIWDSLKVRR